MRGLKSFIEKNIDYEKEHVFYNESFANLTFDYLSGTGYEITKEDELYLNECGYWVSDFEDDGYKILVKKQG